MPAVLDMAKRPAIARETATKARVIVENRQKQTMEILRKELFD